MFLYHLKVKYFIVHLYTYGLACTATAQNLINTTEDMCARNKKCQTPLILLLLLLLLKIFV